MKRVAIHGDCEARKERLMTLPGFTENMLFISSSYGFSHVERVMLNSYPDIVMMDLKMSLTDGIERVRQIKVSFHM